MKKNILFFIFFLVATPAFADGGSSDATATAGATATINSGGVNIDARDQSINDGSKWGFIPPTKQDPALIFPQQPVVWQGPEKVPAYYRGQGFNYVWIEPAYLREGLTIDEMQRLSQASSWWAAMGFGKRAIKKPELSLTRDDLSANGGRLWILPDFPDPRIYTLKKLGEYDADGFARCSIDKLVGNGGLRLAEKGAKYIMVLATSKFLTEGDVKALGTAGVYGKLAGPNSKADEQIVGGAAGAGIGSATAWVDRVPKIKIIAWYDITPAPKIEIPGPWPEKEAAPPAPPVPKAEVAPPKAEAAPVAKPPAEKCEAEKKKIGELEKELDGHKDMLREAGEKLAKAEKEKIVIPPPCTVSVEFDFNRWTIKPDQRKNLDIMADHAAKYAADVAKLGGYFTVIGFADKWVTKHLDHPDKDYINPRLGLQRARMVNAEIGHRLEKQGMAKEQIRLIRPLSGGRDTLNFPEAKTIVESAPDRRAYLVIVLPGVRGTDTAK